MKKYRYRMSCLLMTATAICIGVGIMPPVLSTNAQTQTPKTPVIATISEAVLPGDTVTITGYNLAVDSAFQIAYAPNDGDAPSAFDEDNLPVEIEYLDAQDMLINDEAYGEGLMFIFPETEVAGTYDFWVKTSGGWSNGITLNGVRPQYLSQEATYEGLPIEIVGRNFFQSEYGIGTDASSMDRLRVKLVSAEDPSVSYIVPVEKGVRYTAKESATCKEVYESNPYKITFITPTVSVYGEYDVYVAADGVDFRETEVAQTFEIVEKKEQSWDTTIFGTEYSAHIGNDPLDLQVSWAQDLNYNNVYTVSSNSATAISSMKEVIAEKKNSGSDFLLGTASAVSDLSTTVIEQAQRLSSAGGGVVYFPAGDYYLRGLNFGSTIDNVIFVGDKNGGTNIHFVNSRTSAEYLMLINCTATNGVYKGASNVGWARLNFDRYTHEQITDGNCSIYMADPDMVLYCGYENKDSANIADAISQNKFVSECSFNFNYEKEAGKRASVLLSGEKNVVLQHIDFKGGASLQYGASYKYQTIRNVKIDCTAFSACTVMGLAKYTIIENLWGSNNYDGHGVKIGAYGYIGDSYISKTGGRGEGAENKGEAILIESPNTNFFAFGSISAAMERTFTFTREYGSEITAATRVDFGDIYAYITDGKGVGQARRINYIATNGVYTLAEDERSWEVIPDSTSKVTLIAPSIGNTIYSTTVEDTLKPILLYTNNFDTIVANCTTIKSEGIGVVAVLNPKQGRLVPNNGIRIENNTIKGVSPVTGYAGIYLQTDRGTSGLCYGAEHRNVSIRNNTLENIYRDSGTTYYPNISEIVDLSGIIIGGGGTSRADVGACFVTVEKNVVSGCDEYGVRIADGVYGVVARKNEISNINANYAAVSYNSPLKAVILGYHTLYANGEVSELSGEYLMGETLPTAPEIGEDTYFVGWTTSVNYQDGDEMVTHASGGNITLYAVYAPVAQLVSRNATLTDDISFNQYLSLKEGYTNPVMLYTVNNTTTRVAGVIDGEWYKFSLMLMPQTMAQDIQISVEANNPSGKVVKVIADTTIESFASYCKRLLALDVYAQYHTLLVDLLNYGAEAQKYTATDTDNLANAGVTQSGTTFDESLITSVTSIEGESGKAVLFKGARIYFDSKIGVQIAFTSKSVEGYKAIVSINGETHTFTDFSTVNFNETQAYTFSFNDIMPYQYNVLFTVVIENEEGVAVSGTLTYSVNSFIKRYADTPLYQALWCYGMSAKAIKGNGNFYGNEWDIM